MRTLAVSLLVVFLTAAARAEEAKPPTGRRAVRLDTPASTYHLYAPEAYAPGPSWPLVVALHPARTPAEANLDWYGPEAMRRGWFILAPKARGDRWAASDADLVLAALADVRKTYDIDPLRVCLAGYSSGAGMATSWGLKEHARWRCVFAHAGVLLPSKLPDGDDAPHVLLTAGDRDPAAAHVRTAAARLEKAGFDVATHVHAGMEHYKTTPDVWKRAFDFFAERLALPTERLRRTLRAREEKRWLDAADEMRHLLVGEHDKKLQRRVRQAHAKLVADGLRLVRAASARARREPEAALVELRRWAVVFDGWKPAVKAQEAIARLQAR